MPIAQASTYNPKTKKYFAVSDSYVPDPVVWRHDLWNGVGESPATWDHVKAAAPKLKAIGHPIGIGQSQEIDSNMALIAFMMCFGSFIQNEENRPTILSKKTIDARQVHGGDRRTGETDDIYSWNGNAAGNNNFLYSGTASMIFNAISATRTPESGAAGGQYADDLWIWPIPSGPHGRIGLEHLMGCWSIWKFAQNKPAAQKFLADLCIAARTRRCQSQLYNFPTLHERDAVQGDPEVRGGGHAQAEGQVHDPDHDRGEVHAQHRLSRDDERGDRRDLPEVPDPADVRRRCRRAS